MNSTDVADVYDRMALGASSFGDAGTVSTSTVKNVKRVMQALNLYC